MAIYHCHVKPITRATGRTATGAAAYRAAEKIYDATTGMTHDYTRKGGVVHSEIMLPEGVPQRYARRIQLWNEVEAVEKRKDARVAREIEVALPAELSRAEQIALVQDYAKTFTRDGMIADCCIHDKGDGNPHCHIMLTTRRYDPQKGGFGNKARDWDAKEKLQEWREEWERVTNTALERAGRDERIDHRTLEAQGIDREPQIHHGNWRGLKKINEEIKKNNELLNEIATIDTELKEIEEIKQPDIEKISTWDDSTLAEELDRRRTLRSEAIAEYAEREKAVLRERRDLELSRLQEAADEVKKARETLEATIEKDGKIMHTVKAAGRQIASFLVLDLIGVDIYTNDEKLGDLLIDEEEAEQELSTCKDRWGEIISKVSEMSVTAEYARGVGAELIEEIRIISDEIARRNEPHYQPDETLTLEAAMSTINDPSDVALADIMSEIETTKQMISTLRDKIAEEEQYISTQEIWWERECDKAGEAIALYEDRLAELDKNDERYEQERKYIFAEAAREYVAAYPDRTAEMETRRKNVPVLKKQRTEQVSHRRNLESVVKSIEFEDEIKDAIGAFTERPCGENATKIMGLSKKAKEINKPDNFRRIIITLSESQRELILELYEKAKEEEAKREEERKREAERRAAEERRRKEEEAARKEQQKRESTIDFHLAIFLDGMNAPVRSKSWTDATISAKLIQETFVECKKANAKWINPQLAETIGRHAETIEIFADIHKKDVERAEKARARQRERDRGGWER